MGGFGFPEMFHEKPQTCVSLVEKLINWSLFKKLRTQLCKEPSGIGANALPDHLKTGTKLARK